MLHVPTVVEVSSNRTFVWFITFGESFLWASLSLANVGFPTALKVTSYTILDFWNFVFLGQEIRQFFGVVNDDKINRKI